jgi:hypothetical protein
MRVSIRKTVVAAVADLGMATAVATISTPAEAQFHGGGFHGGGGFRGGGWRGGWGGGWGWGGSWGWGYDPGWAIAAATVPIGVAIASQPAYGGGPGCWVRGRVWTANGHYMGRRLMNVCY